MSPNINSFAGGEGQAVALAELITFKPVSTGIITRGTGTVAAQTVRLETLSGSRQVQGENGQTYQIDAFLLAAYGANLKPGDRFTVAGQMFEIEMIMPGHTDCTQCYLRLRR